MSYIGSLPNRLASFKVNHGGLPMYLIFCRGGMEGQGLLAWLYTEIFMFKFGNFNLKNKILA